MDKINRAIDKHISKEQLDICNFLKEHFKLNEDEFRNALDVYYNKPIKQHNKCIAINKLNGHTCAFIATCGEYCKKHKQAMDLEESRRSKQNSNFVCVHITEISDMGESRYCGKPSKNNMWVCGYHKKFQNYLKNEYRSSNIEEYKKLVQEEKIKSNSFIDDVLSANKNDM